MEETPAVQLTAWQMLRAAREERGLTIAEVAQHLKLTPRQVEAMEAGDLAHLPGPAFARGFVRNYARFLQLDPARFNEVLDVVREVPQQMGSSLPLGQMPGPARWRLLPALGIAAALLALVIAGWYFRWFEPRDEQYLADVMGQSAPVAESGNSAPLASAPVAVPLAAQSEPSAPTADIVAASAAVAAPMVSASTPVAASASSVAASSVASSAAAVSSSRASSAASSSSVASSTSAANSSLIAAVPKVASAPAAQPTVITGPVPKGSHRLHLAFDSDAWVEVRDANNKVIFSRLNPAGSEQDVQGEAPLQVVIGNAPQVRLTVDGKAMELGPKTSSNVARLNLP
jgi:cytoskeleton protein RodZ